MVQPVAFLILSEDLLIQILDLLAPDDILSVRATCRSLVSVTRRRVVWLSAFASICHRYGVVEGSYSVPHMSQADLEAACLRPSQFVRLVMRTDRNTNVSPRTMLRIDGNVARIPLFHTVHMPPAFLSTFLVPGGKFLLTDYEHCVINLWDLDALTQDPTSWVPTASLRVQEEDKQDSTIQLFAPCVRPDGKAVRFGLRVLVEESETEIRMYELFPTESPPMFHLLHKLRAIVMPRRIDAFDGERLVFVSSGSSRDLNRINIWDLNAKSSVDWEVPSTLEKVVLLENYLITYDSSRDLKIWDIPSEMCHSVDMNGSMQPRFQQNVQDWAHRSCYIFQPRRPMQSIDPVIVVMRLGADFLPQTRPPSLKAFAVLPPSSNSAQEVCLPELFSIELNNIGMDAHRSPSGLFIDNTWATLWSEQGAHSSVVKISLVGANKLYSDSVNSEENHVKIVSLMESAALYHLTFCPVSLKLVFLDYQGNLYITTYSI